jgi:hypothetical protein
MENQRRLEGDLRARKAAAPARAKNYMNAMAPHAAPAPLRDSAGGSGTFGSVARYETEEGAVPSSPSVDVRITGWWRWKTVVVPPNAHVVHTRRGHKTPLHLGLGTSFRYNPATDSFLVVPGTMQTILINAQCICRELQGLLVQGYVQWVVADFPTAYTKLDFTDTDDPMRVVNVQLREQAEAAIKDKVATMGIDDVLSDKQTIIEELTARLRAVAEGAGLGIITVQIKEAVVSSRTVWETLQKPFRTERARVARLAELDAQTAIAAREASVEREIESGKLQTEAQLATLRAEHEATEAAARQLATERTLTITELEHAAQLRQAKLDLELEEATQKLANTISAESLQARLIDVLPAIAEKLPKQSESLVEQVLAILDQLKRRNA